MSEQSSLWFQHCCELFIYITVSYITFALFSYREILIGSLSAVRLHSQLVQVLGADMVFTPSCPPSSPAQDLWISVFTLCHFRVNNSTELQGKNNNCQLHALKSLIISLIWFLFRD